MIKRKEKKQDIDVNNSNEPAGEEILLEAIRLLPEDVVGQTEDAEAIVQQGEKKKQKLRLLKWAAVAAVILLILAVAWKSGIYPFGETNKQKQSISVEESSEAVQ